MTRDAASAALHLPPAMRYDCLQCGRSCVDFEEVRVDEATMHRLAGLDLAPLRQPDRPNSPPEPAVVESPWTPGESMLNKCAGRACTFLGEGELCELHRAHGSESKPLGCRSFPFGFVETPGGVFTALSFACTAVLRNQGRPVDEQEDEVRATLAFSPVRRRAGAGLFLGQSAPLTWEQYASIEADLAHLIARPDLSVPLALRAQSIYLRLFAQFLLQARDAAGSPPGEAPEANDEPLAVFRKQMGAGDAATRWARLIATAAQPRRPSAVTRRVALGYVLAFRKALGRRGRLGTIATVTRAYLAHALGRGTIEIPGAEPRRVAYTDLAAVAFDPERPEHADLLRRFFDHALFRKDLLRFSELGFSHNMMLISYGLIDWHARSLASLDAAPAVEPEHLLESVRLVEEYFVFHSRFAQTFAEHPMLRAMLESLFRGPLFPFAMTQSVVQ